MRSSSCSAPPTIVPVVSVLIVYTPEQGTSEVIIAGNRKARHAAWIF
jgi:hypothetical protein